MKAIRQIGSLAFVVGLFTVVFAGIPWHVMVADDPVVPWWLRPGWRGPITLQWRPNVLV